MQTHQASTVDQTRAIALSRQLATYANVMDSLVRIPFTRQGIGADAAVGCRCRLLAGSPAPGRRWLASPGRPVGAAVGAGVGATTGAAAGSAADHDPQPAHAHGRVCRGG